LLEEVYNLEDALLVGGLINSLIRNADRVKIACLAQLVNVIAPIMTNPDGMFRQTIFYPYSWALRYAKGAVLNLLVESASYTVPGLDSVPYVDVSGTLDDPAGTATIFALNRDLSKPQKVEFEWQDRSPSKVVAAWLLTGDDLKAANSFADPKRIVPQAFSIGAPKGSRSVLELPAHSYAAIQWSLA
jgi:alpha-N-arabinofuranosidase